MKTVVLILFLIFQLALRAQISVSSGSYFQDFGTIDITSWTNNVTYPGWYMAGTFQSHQDITTAVPSNSGGFYTYECNGNNDQKIGSRASGGSGTLRYGVVLQNTTGSAISHVRVAYKGYQLSLAQNGAINTIAFDYVVGSTAPAIGATGGTAVPALNFTQLQSNTTSGSNQVMGYPCTQMTTLSSCITVNIPNNSYILLRWTDVDDAGNDHHMAVDDIDVQFLATNLTVNSATICNTQTATLTASGASSYSWSPGIGLSATSGSVVSANPSSSTVYTITGTVPSCPSKTVSSTVTVNAAASITVSSQTVCSGGTATLSASGASSYSWSPATGLSSTTGATVFANPASTTVYTVTGPGGACPAIPGIATVNVIPSAAISAPSQTICSMAQATLTASGANSYTWSPGASLSSVNGSSVIATPSSSTIYTIQATSGTCPVTTHTLSLTVVPIPVITVNSATVCATTAATLIASGATTYTWTPAATLSSVNGNQVLAYPLVTTVYTVSGSVSSCPPSTASATVTVLPVPSISVSQASICASGSALLTASGANSYSWSPAGSLSAATGATVNANPGSSTIYTVTGTIGTCTAQATSTLTVVPLQSAAFSYPSNNYCNSSSSNPAPIITGVSGGLFTSSSPDLSINGSSGIINLSLTVPKTYTVNYTTQGNCPDQQQVILTISPAPSLTVASATVCQGQNVLLSAATSPGGGTFQWLPGNQTGPSVSLLPTASTNYTVNYSLNGCKQTTVASVTVIPPPTVALIPSASPVMEGQPLSVSATGGGNYMWDNGTTGSTLSLMPQETADYCVTVTNNEGCRAHACITVELLRESTLYVPNTFTPNGDGLNDLFDIPQTNMTAFHIRIFNRWGALLFESDAETTRWDGTYKGAAVAEDVYVYTITAKDANHKEYVWRGHVTVMR